MNTAMRDYLDAVVAVLSTHDGYLASVLVGSLASHDFQAASSDVDLIALFRAPLARGDKEALTARLNHRALPCPARGLDLIAYLHAETRDPSAELAYEFSIASGATWEDEISFGGPYPGGLIDLAAAHEFGSVLEGSGVASSIGPVDRGLLREELRLSLLWHLDHIHDPFHDPTGSNAVLNACRALHFLRSGELVSKAQGAKGFLAGSDAGLVRSALEARRSPKGAPLARDRVSAFVRRVLEEFAAGA